VTAHTAAQVQGYFALADLGAMEVKGVQEPLLDATAGTRGLIIVNFRPEYHAPWMGKSYYQQLALLPLGAEVIRQLLDALLGTDPSIAGLAEAIHARTAGNPFFTEEVVQSLIESGRLQGSTGAYRLVTAIDTLEVPTSVHALLAARIDRLGEREKGVLQTAAVIGREFGEPTLAAVAELPAPQLREALRLFTEMGATGHAERLATELRIWAPGMNATAVPYQMVRTRPDLRMRSSFVSSGTSRRSAVPAMSRSKGSTRVASPRASRTSSHTRRSIGRPRCAATRSCHSSKSM